MVLSFRTGALLGLAFFLAGCGGGGSSSSGKHRVGLVFDLGGRGDKSFNDSAYEGVARAAKELGIEFDYIEPGDGADREAALRQLASSKDELIFGVGFLFTDDIALVAKDFPNKKFGCIDFAVNPNSKMPDNLVALKFREHEGSFLVGAIAGLVSKTNAVGFVGGMDIPLIHKFEAGFAAGAKAVNPKVKVLTGYAGVTGEAFKNPAKGKAISYSQIGQGADVIFHASGTTGLGVFEAAREKKIFAIGVDADQFSEAPGFILTSMLKRGDVAVYKTIEALLTGRFKSGVQEFGLAEGGVGYVYDANNKSLIPEAVVKRVEELKAKIVKGEIKVPAS
ncbi:MAG: BMP family ABC transporter substrate-binding protein [Elusimicrobia bacterium]|nr:BMP family ABC transporter substrate-binding protein [Elusimicrobiota bacterium]